MSVKDAQPVQGSEPGVDPQCGLVLRDLKADTVEDTELTAPVARARPDWRSGWSCPQVRPGP